MGIVINERKNFKLQEQEWLFLLWYDKCSKDYGMNAWRVEKSESFTLVVQKVFIIPEPYRFDGVERPESHFLLIILMRDKNPLHIINEEKISLTDH